MGAPGASSLGRVRSGPSRTPPTWMDLVELPARREDVSAVRYASYPRSTTFSTPWFGPETADAPLRKNKRRIRSVTESGRLNFGSPNTSIGINRNAEPIQNRPALRDENFERDLIRKHRNLIR
jgi:hypothetical protein